MNQKTTFRVSVRDLAAAAAKPKDLSRGFSSHTRAMAGIREHTRLQNLWPKGWEKEVSISLRIKKPSFDLEIFGRMDGLFVSKTRMKIQEIKTCSNDPKDLAACPDPKHLAQLKCYGYMMAKEKDLEAIDLILTYAKTPGKKTAAWEKTLKLKALETFFDQLVSTYLSLLGSRTAWENIRNPSLAGLDFPYERFRKGQRDLAKAAYKIIKHGRILFARAPTGTGKTMATLFPALKAMGHKETDQIFYLTAKSPGRTVAQKAIKDLAKAGARVKSVTLTAKQKTCFTPDIPCDMETCVYAKAYYTKLASAMARAENHDLFDQALIETLAAEFEICPFEFSLDLSLISDIIICDFNYAFDPRVYLKRFFDRNTQKLCFLVDEAHNLPDRLRSMYSADLEKTLVIETQKIVRDEAPGLGRALVNINKEMTRLQTAWLDRRDFFPLKELPENLMETLDKFAAKADLWLDTHPGSPVREIVLEAFFTINGFLNLTRYFGSHFRIFIEQTEYRGLAVRIFCLDPSPIFSSLIKRCRTAVFFSATFFPFPFYEQMLFGPREQDRQTDPEKTAPLILDHTQKNPRNKKEKKSAKIIPHTIALSSPFPKEYFKLIIHNRIQTTFRQRRFFYKDVAKMIILAVKKRPGNHMIFFSSYAYMEAVLDLMDLEQIPGNFQVQHPGMGEDQRQDFLDKFTFKSRITGFAVMGGIFSEGIDLTGDRLIGVIVVGVGLPQVNPETDEIRAYYDNMGQDGFFMAYQMPGFSRVLQATGRLIRSGQDKGVALLLDERFLRQDYLNLFPLEWEGFETISEAKDLNSIIGRFSTIENQ